MIFARKKARTFRFVALSELLWEMSLPLGRSGASRHIAHCAFPRGAPLRHSPPVYQIFSGRQIRETVL